MNKLMEFPHKIVVGTNYSKYIDHTGKYAIELILINSDIIDKIVRSVSR